MRDWGKMSHPLQYSLSSTRTRIVFHETFVPCVEPKSFRIVCRIFSINLINHRIIMKSNYNEVPITVLLFT